MTTTTSPTVSRTTAPRRPRLAHDEAMRLARANAEHFLAELRALSSDDWSTPTECPGWDVRAMVAHLLGMAEMAASLREQLRQMRAAKRRQRRDRGLQIDALTAVQVEKHRDLTPEQLIAQLESVIPKAIRARSRIPSFVRNRKLPERQLVGGTWEDWTIGFLTEVVLTRDPFMHRIDIARATGTQMQLEAGTEGRLVADAAAEWAERHGQPCTVHLTGPAGGTYSWGSGGPEITYDALEFCRALADRAPLDDLFGQSVPF